MVPKKSFVEKMCEELTRQITDDLYTTIIEDIGKIEKSCRWQLEMLERTERPIEKLKIEYKMN